MEDRRHLPPDGGGNPKLSSSVIQSECDTEVRVDRKEHSDPETSRRKDDLCDVPRKVPRFQYVDFPSLHQCIQQLSVPPLNSWLGSCSLAKTPNCQPASPKENVPKFKYVDYPSLHHCIQQLSVPPLESWSAGLIRLNTERGQEGSGGQKRPSPPGTLRDGQRVERNEAVDQNKEDRSRVTAFSFPSLDPAKLRDTHTKSARVNEKRPMGHSHIENTSERERGPPKGVEKGKAPLMPSGLKSETGLRSDCGFRSETRLEFSSGSQTDTAVVRNERPSVINMAHIDKQNYWTKADRLEEQCNSPDSVGRVPWKTLPESVCPFCQQMFTNPEQFRAHQRSHRDKRPN